MAVDYASIAAEVADAIAEVGGSAIIRRTTTSGPSYDPVITTTDYPCTLFQDSIDLTKVTGTLIETSDRRALVSSSDLAIVPTTADKLVIGGVEHAMKSIQPLQPNPGDVAVMYEVYYVA